MSSPPPKSTTSNGNAFPFEQNKGRNDRDEIANAALISMDANNVTWKPEDFARMKHLFLTIDNMKKMYTDVMVYFNDHNDRWVMLQFWVSFCATIIAFLSVSPLVDLVPIGRDKMRDLSGVFVGFLSLSLTVINDQIKKRKYLVKINECHHIRTEYENMRIRVQSEMRFPKTQAVTLEAHMSRLCQEINMKHELEVPSHIEKKTTEKFLKEMENMGGEEIVRNDEKYTWRKGGMARDSIVEVFSNIKKAQKPVQKKKSKNHTAIVVSSVPDKAFKRNNRIAHKSEEQDLIHIEEE